MPRLPRTISFSRFNDTPYVGDRDPRHAELCHRVLDIPVKKTVSSAMTYLDRDEMKALLAIPAPAQRLGLRDRALLTFFYNTGARASEAVATSIRDIRFETPSQARLLGKGRKERACPLVRDRQGPLWNGITDAFYVSGLDAILRS
jgi:integrase